MHKLLSKPHENSFIVKFLISHFHLETRTKRPPPWTFSKNLQLQETPTKQKTKKTFSQKNYKKTPKNHHPSTQSQKTFNSKKPQPKKRIRNLGSKKYLFDLCEYCRWWVLLFSDRLFFKDPLLLWSLAADLTLAVSIARLGTLGPDDPKGTCHRWPLASSRPDTRHTSNDALLCTLARRRHFPRGVWHSRYESNRAHLTHPKVVLPKLYHPKDKCTMTRLSVVCSCFPPHFSPLPLWCTFQQPVIDVLKPARIHFRFTRFFIYFFFAVAVSSIPSKNEPKQIQILNSHFFPRFLAGRLFWKLFAEKWNLKSTFFAAISD